MHSRYKSIYEMEKKFHSAFCNRKKISFGENFHRKLALKNIIMNGGPFVDIEKLFVASIQFNMCVLCRVYQYPYQDKLSA